MTLTRELVMDRERIEALPWLPFDHTPGVAQRVLWHDDTSGSYAGMLRLDKGASIPLHTHRSAAHHVWVLAGTCEIEGTSLTSGSYVFVPAALEHGIHDTGSTGCTLFYLYLPADRD